MEKADTCPDFALADAPKRTRKVRSDKLPPQRRRSFKLEGRCTQEYRDFITAYCRDLDKTVAELLDEAIADHVRRNRYKRPLPPMGYLPLPKPVRPKPAAKPAAEGLKLGTPRRRRPQVAASN